MNTEQKKKLELLRSQAQTKERKQSLQKNVLLQECLEALGTFEILEKEDQIKNIESLVTLQDAEMHSHEDRIILDEEEKYYIVWDEATLPIVVSLGRTIMKCWDDVLAVAFDTYLVSESFERIVGIRH